MSGIIAQNTLDSSGLIKSPAGGGAWTFIKKLTASSDGTLDFVNGADDVVLDSTYKEYLFYWVDVHPSTGAKFQFNLSSDTGSSYDVTKTSTVFRAYNAETAGTSGLDYQTGLDLANGTGPQFLGEGFATASDDCGSGYLHLFDIANTTFVKHYISRQSHESGGYAWAAFVAGYANTTSAVDAVQFSFSAGNIDLGDIFLHGLTI